MLKHVFAFYGTSLFIKLHDCFRAGLAEGKDCISGLFSASDGRRVGRVNYKAL